MVRYSFSIDEEHLPAGKHPHCPLRVFTLAELGIADDFRRDIGPTFDQLPWDEYDRALYHTSAFRQRAMAKFLVTRTGDAWQVEHVAEQSFSQNVGDHRQEPRAFAPMTSQVTEHAGFRKLLEHLALVIVDLKPTVQRMMMTCHQVRTIARDGKESPLTPEGMHQDGVNFLVSALVIQTNNVTGGISIISSKDPDDTYLNITLLPGQGIFQVDAGSVLWHRATPIRQRDPAADGTRDILGFDIDITD